MKMDKPEPGALECTRCGCRRFEVVGVVPLKSGRRRVARECGHCGARITRREAGDAAAVRNYGPWVKTTLPGGGELPSIWGAGSGRDNRS